MATQKNKKTAHKQVQIKSSGAPAAGAQLITETIAIGSIPRGLGVSGNKYVYDLAKDGTLKLGRLIIPQVSANPADPMDGQIAYVSGKLKIYVLGTGWVTVGTQT